MNAEHGAEDWERQAVRLVPEPVVASPLRSGVCHTHPDRAGSFRCAGCALLFCDECAPEKLMSGELVRFCSLCGGVCAEVDEESPDEAGPGPGSAGQPVSPMTATRLRKPPPRPPAPEPPPPDRQLFSILIYPFKGLGAMWLLVWCASLFAAWPFVILLFVPYLWSLYLAAEHDRPRPPAPWRLGGGPWQVTGRWMKLLISPGLLVALCYALLSGRSPVAGAADRVGQSSGGGIMTTAGLVLLMALVFLLPLLLVVLFRTGSPFTTLDPAVLLAILRRSPSRYLACFVSLLVVAGFALGVYLLLRLVPFPAHLPGLRLVARPHPAAFLAGVLAIVWGATALGRYGHWVSWCLNEDEE